MAALSVGPRTNIASMVASIACFAFNFLHLFFWMSILLSKLIYGFW